MPQRHRTRNASEGFTLIEISIVLVVIGLIVGAIMVGADMIKAAQLRATIGQIEKYSSAVETFRTKYKSLPGDISPAKAAQFGMAARTGDIGNGDEDGLIEGSRNGSNGFAGTEVVMFWNDLSVSGLIEGGYNGQDVDAGPPDPSCTNATPKTLFPTAKLGTNILINAYGDQSDSNNYFSFLGNVSSINNWCLYIGELPAMSPLQAYIIDLKLDDGYPLTGGITARSPLFFGNAIGGPPWIPALDTPAAPAAGVCVSNAAGNPYNTLVAPDTPACQIRMRFN